jgi:hypothetical protein
LIVRITSTANTAPATLSIALIDDTTATLNS